MNKKLLIVGFLVVLLTASLLLLANPSPKEEEEITVIENAPYWGKVEGKTIRTPIPGVTYKYIFDRCEVAGVFLPTGNYKTYYKEHRDWKEPVLALYEVKAITIIKGEEKVKEGDLIQIAQPGGLLHGQIVRWEGAPDLLDTEHEFILFLKATLEDPELPGIKFINTYHNVLGDSFLKRQVGTLKFHAPHGQEQLPELRLSGEYTLEEFKSEKLGKP
ncbi:MAG: hypothetical protein ACETVR_01895 [Candidatus Bathyarchaeia archaeon]